MKFDPDIHQRHSIRLAEYDYSSAGFYFVTICVQERECLLGEIVDSEVILNDAGRMVAKTWQELPAKYPDIAIDEYVIMSNHFHGIIILQQPDPSPVGAGPRACPGFNKSQTIGHPQGGAPTEMGQLSLPDVVHRFKSLTTARYRHGVNHHNWPPFSRKLWQRNYYERIIRNENELQQTRQYIHDNPTQWESDDKNPTNLQNNCRRGAACCARCRLIS